MTSEFSASSYNTGRDSQIRSSYKKAPKVSKNAFPEDFSMPSPAQSRKKQRELKESKLAKDDDLDDLLNQAELVVGLPSMPEV